VDEGKEMGMMDKQRPREIRHVGIRGVDVPFCQCEEPPLDRPHLRDQLGAREWCAADMRIGTKAVPQPKQLPLQGQGLATEAFGRGRRRQFVGTQ
jgi:hypothetical protein